MKNPRGVFEKVKGSGVWWIRYHDSDSRLRREKAGTKAVATKLYIKRKQEALEGCKLPENLKKRKTTFGELMDAAIEYTEQNTPTGEEKRYKCRMKLIREMFGMMTADSITPEVLSRWLTEQRKKNNWRPATVNRYKAFFSLAFRLGMENGKCKTNPARLVKRLPEENERTRFLSEEEEERIRKVIERDCPEHMPEFEIALHCGIRQGEQYKLLWSDVDLAGSRATLRKTKNKTKRHPPLNAVARRALQQLFDSSEEDQERVFIGERGNPHGLVIATQQGMERRHGDQDAPPDLAAGQFTTFAGPGGTTDVRLRGKYREQPVPKGLEQLLGRVRGLLMGTLRLFLSRLPFEERELKRTV